MASELEQAVKRYKARKYKADSDLGPLSFEQIGDLLKLADAYIAEADQRRRDEVEDALPVTKEWLWRDCRGWSQEGHLCFAKDGVHVNIKSDKPTMVNVEFLSPQAFATRGDVRRLLSALHITPQRSE